MIEYDDREDQELLLPNMWMRSLEKEKVMCNEHK